MKRAAAALLCLMVACGGSSDSGADGEETPTEVVGLITEVKPEGDFELPTSFTVEEDDGDTYTVDIDPQLDYGFDLLHVREHFVAEDPVTVAVESRDGALIATTIEDAE